MKWNTRRLGDVANLSLGKMLDEKKNRGEPLPYLANINVRWGEFDLENPRDMRFEEDEKERFGLKSGDIVMCEGGEPGRCAIWNDAVSGMMTQKALHRIRPHACLNNRFLFYSFLHTGKIGGFTGLFTGSTIKHLPAQQLAKFEIRFPELSCQLGIANVLSAYDDLMENNRRRMALLQESARLLYRKWFVRLRFPGHEKERCVSGLPKTWTCRPLRDCAKFLSGGTPSKVKHEFWEGEIPWVSSGELVAKRIHDTSLHVTEEAVNDGSRMVPAETTLVEVRGMSLAKEFRMALTSRPVAFNQDLKALIPVPELDGLFLFHALEAQRDEIRERATEASHGTKKLDTAVLSSVPIPVPPQRFQRDFREIVQPIHAQWDNLSFQNQKLRTARDHLLPRLMSGELAV